MCAAGSARSAASGRPARASDPSGAPAGPPPAAPAGTVPARWHTAASGRAAAASAGSRRSGCTGSGCIGRSRDTPATGLLGHPRRSRARLVGAGPQTGAATRTGRVDLVRVGNRKPWDLLRDAGDHGTVPAGRELRLWVGGVVLLVGSVRHHPIGGEVE